MFKPFTVLLLAAACLSAADDIPRVDLHAHLAGANAPTPAEAVALSQKLGVRFGIANESANDQGVAAFLGSMEGQPLWRGLQVRGAAWRTSISAQNLARIDYILSDGLMFPDNGTIMPIWSTKATFADPQDFMDRYLAHNLSVLALPIQIWASATLLPASLKDRYDELWTPQRMDRLIEAVVKNNIAIEINSRWETPKAGFIRRAKAAGAKFSIGTDQHGAGIGQIDYSLRVANECGLTAKDFFVPSRDLGK
jgi:hypothetical protein